MGTVRDVCTFHYIVPPRNVEIIHFQEFLLSVPLPRNLNPYLDIDYGKLRDFKSYLAHEFPILSFLCM